MIVVTGGAGFIGSNLIHEPNRIGDKATRAEIGNVQDVYQGIFNAGQSPVEALTQWRKPCSRRMGQRRSHIPFPADLTGRCQHFTKADLALLRQRGHYTRAFTSLEDGVRETSSA